MTVISVHGGKPSKLRQLQKWQVAFRDIRAQLRDAMKLSGTARKRAFVRVCRALSDATAEPPVPWRRDKRGGFWRVFNESTRVYDAAELRLEKLVADAVGCCPGCVAMQTLPEDRLKRRRQTRTT